MGKYNRKPSILIVDDETGFRESLEMALEDIFSITVADSLSSARRLLKDTLPDAILLDIRLPDGNGDELLHDLKLFPKMPVVFVMTAYATVEHAVSALRLGAVDYLVKPFDLARLRRELTVHLENRALHNRIDALDREFKKLAPPFVTTGAGAMKDIVEKAPMIAALNIPVLIKGDTGTGKEQLARWIHTLSGLTGELVSINCAALPKDIIESELFGYVKGAFSGAFATKEGLVEKAGGGILFLDEIGELPDAVQAKFLRLLEDGVYYKLGDTRERRANFRLVSASNRDLADATSTFRRDLYYRINGMTFELPPLRERRDDIPLLVAAFIKDANYAYKKEIMGIAPQVARQLVSYDWPGNIRELKWCINRAVAMTAGDIITAEDLDFETAPARSPAKTADFSVPFTEAMNELEKRYIIHALSLTSDNKTEAAKILGISVRALHYKLNKHDL